MTCQMAAGQQKKRFTSSSLHDPFKARKKKKLDASDTSDCVLNLRPHVDLDYDEKCKKVVPRRDQVGLAWKDLAPFVESIPQPCKGLADVIQVPKEIFGLKDLSDVLSFEVWNSCLSESDRKLLSQFLPSGSGMDQVVHSLLKGEDHHFGNQFSNWSDSVCAGNMHPDVVRLKEKEFRSNKKAYYVEISKYHSSMIENLERWKEKWLSCKDPEQLLRDAPSKQKKAIIAGPPEKSKVTRKEIPPKIVRTSDTKYLSCIKINSTQLEQIKNLRHSGDGIQQKLLTPVLGDIKKLNIKSYESLEDEEKKILNEHWLQVVKKDVPLAFKTWKERKLEIEQLMQSLNQELAGREISRMEEDEKVETESDQLIPEEFEEEQQEDEKELKEETEESDDSSSDSEESEDDDEETREPKSEEATEEEKEEEETEAAEEEEITDVNITTNVPSYRNDLERIPSLNSHHPTVEEKTETDTETETETETDSVIPVLQFQTEEISEPTNSDKWCPVETFDLSSHQQQPPPEYFPHPTGTGSGTGAGTSGMIGAGPSGMIDLEREVMQMDNNASLFCPELIPSFQKEPQILPQANFLSLQSHQAEQRLIERRRQMTENSLYMHQTQQAINKQVQAPVYHTNSYSNHQAHLAQIGPHQSLNITNSAPRFPVSNPGYTWFPQDHQMHNSTANNNGNNNWSGMDTSSASSDGSLFSVLSECNKIPPRVQQYQSVNMEQYTGPRNFGMSSVVNNNNTNNSNNMFGYLPAQMASINNSGGTGANTATGTMDSLAWANFRRQNSNLNPGLPDNLGRPFSRPWER